MSFFLLKHHLTPKWLLTQFAGWLANVQVPWVKDYLIRDFIQRYQVDMSEATREAADYRHFNDFFTRQLRPHCRPLAAADIVSPADGCVVAAGAVDDGQLLQAKGRYYSVRDLLVQAERAEHFVNGHYATIYLSPRDYHRVHMPVTGQLLQTVYVPGRLFSVQPRTVKGIRDIFCRNERLVCFFNTDLGQMAIVLVGATLVGAIGTAWHGLYRRQSQTQVQTFAPDAVTLQQGQEMGLFQLGSTVIVLFAKDFQSTEPALMMQQSKVAMGAALAAPQKEMI